MPIRHIVGGYDESYQLPALSESYRSCRNPGRHAKNDHSMVLKWFEWRSLTCKPSESISRAGTEPPALFSRGTHQITRRAVFRQRTLRRSNLIRRFESGPNRRTLGASLFFRFRAGPQLEPIPTSCQSCCDNPLQIF